MSKLTTAVLKDMIGAWLSTPEIRDDIMQWHEGLGEVEEKLLWSMWCDGSQWKRHERYTLKDNWVDYFSMTEYLGEWKPGLPGNQQEHREVPYFPVDTFGEANMELVTKYFNDPKQAAKCILRCFYPNNDFADNFRLEVVTTPEDDAVVGWTVIAD